MIKAVDVKLPIALRARTPCELVDRDRLTGPEIGEVAYLRGMAAAFSSGVFAAGSGLSDV
jgi:hypothetical protein